MSAILSRPRPLHDVPVSLHSIDLAVRALRSKLNELNYCPAISREICIHAHLEHNIAGLVEAGLIEREDEAALEDAFADGWPEIDPRSVLWKSPDRWSADPAPTPEEARQYAMLDGRFDTLDVTDAPLEPPADLEPDDVDWDEWAEFSASLDPTCPHDRYLEAELAEIGVTRH